MGIDGGSTERDARQRHLERVGTTVLVLVGAAVGYGVLGTDADHIADEGFHAPQIWSLFVGNLEVLPTTTMLPMYHVVLAMAERLFGLHDLRLLRIVNLLGSLFLPVLVWRMSSLHSPQDPGRRTVQWFFMPLLFPFYFLVYTDAWALVAVLATTHCALNGRVALAALAGLAATLLRQDMIIWVGLAWFLVLCDDFDPAAWRRDRTKYVRSQLGRAAPLFVVLASFVVFYVWNAGVAVGDRARHQVGFNVTNVFYFLLCAWVIFLPVNLEAAPRVLSLLRRPAFLVVIVAGFLFYMGTYANDHVLNGPDVMFYLHNKGLYLLTEFRWIRALAYVPMAWMVMTACVTRLADRRLYLLYAVAPLAAGLHPVIEQRYYLPALTLFQAWRPAVGGRWENSMLGLYVLETLVIVPGITGGSFFL